MNNFFNSTNSDIFYVEESSTELSPRRNINPEIVNSTELSGAPAIEHLTISSVASSEPKRITVHSDSNEPTILYRYGGKDPIVPPSLNYLNLPANPFNKLATMELVHPTARTHDDNYSSQSPEPSDSFSISTPPMNLSTLECWETAHTTTDGNIFYSDEEPMRIYFLICSPSPPPPPRKLKRKMSSGMSFPERKGVSQHVCETCGETLPTRKNISGLSTD